MGKHILILLMLSLISILWIKEITHVLNYLIHGYIYLSKCLKPFIMGGYMIAILRQALVLMMIPMLVMMIPAGIYWLIRRRLMPWFYEAVYAAWFVMLTTLALYK